MGDVPTPSGWVFYLSNLIIVSGYLFASALITRRKGMAAGMSTRAWVAGLSFFGLCGLTHIELAVHAFFNLRVINLDGTVSWHMLAIHIPQGVSIWAFLWAMQLEAPPPHTPGEPVIPIPLEGFGADPVAFDDEVSTNENGPPHSFPYEPDNPEGTVR